MTDRIVCLCTLSHEFQHRPYSGLLSSLVLVPLPKAKHIDRAPWLQYLVFGFLIRTMVNWVTGLGQDPGRRSKADPPLLGTFIL